jgi:hypothetical protein
VPLACRPSERFPVLSSPEDQCTALSRVLIAPTAPFFAPLFTLITATAFVAWRGGARKTRKSRPLERS